MTKHKSLAFILLGVLTLTFIGTSVFSCGKTKDDEAASFAFNGAILQEQYKPNETIALQLLNPENKSIDSVVYFVNDKNAGSVKGLEKINFDLKGQKLGYQNLKAMVFFEGKNVEVTDRVELVSDVTAKILKYTVVNTYPHDITAFTEGLEFFRDTLIESTGQKGSSYFRKFDYKTGKVYRQVDLNAQYFGEGITVINNKIYQLTWQDNTGLIYDANTLKQVKTFKYDKQIEGWGMTNDGKHIYHSDGTEKIWKMDPETQKMIGYVNVYWAANKIKSINELEYIDGLIYGNIWQKDAIAIFDPATGSVQGVLDLSALRKEITSPTAEVLNGIAYNPKTKTLFVTGKNWDKMFEIRVSE